MSITKLDCLNTDARIQRYCYNHKIMVKVEAHVKSFDGNKEGIGVIVQRMKQGGHRAMYVITPKEMVDTNLKFEDFMFELIVEMERQITQSEKESQDNGKRIILN